MLAFLDSPGHLEDENSPCEAVERKALDFTSAYVWNEEQIEVGHHV